ncbi:MAG: LLM class flavin-dependent oxidoreductase [Actinomycetota bacterium]
MSAVKVGVTLPQFTDDAARFIDGARRAEKVGLDSVWVFDHLWPMSGGRERPVIEAWTALAWVAAITSRIGIGSLVARSSLRHPAVLAKIAATVAAIAPGRLTVGIGSGDQLSRAENEAFGFPYWAAEKRTEQLTSAVQVLRTWFHSNTVSLRDNFVGLRELPATPPTETSPPIWVGGRSGDALEIAALLADGWNGWGGDARRWAQDAATVIAAAGGRALELSWGGTVILGADDDEARSKLARRDPGKYVWGGPERVAEEMAPFVEAGARHLIVSFPDAGTPGVYELLAEKVVPQLG